MTDLVAQVTLGTLWQSPIVWGLTLGAVGFLIAFADTRVPWRRLGLVIAAAGFIVLLLALPRLSVLSTSEQWTQQVVFWLLAGVSVACSAAAVTARNPVYTAIWFAASLLGVAGLFLFQNAQFLGVATVVVYAGAIVVTFLFVLMLANPEGHARYDRISWASFPVPIMILASAAFTGLIAFSFLNQQPAATPTRTEVLASSDHVAHLGGELFARHMISVEIAGTILLVALVGAIAIVIQGKERRGIASASDTAVMGRELP